MSQHKHDLTRKIIIYMIAGAIFGVILYSIGRWGMGYEIDPVKRQLLYPATVTAWLFDGVFRLVGKVFIHLLQMLVVPLVFVSLFCGTASLKDPAQLGKLGIKTLALYLLTTAIAISVALLAASVIQPGAGFDLPNNLTFAAKSAPSLIDILINMVPKNPLAAMAEGNMLQIILFAILFGLSATLAGAAGQRLIAFFTDVNEVIMQLVTLVMKLAPYAVFVLIASVFGRFGFDALGNLSSYFFLVIAVLLFHGLVVYSAMLKILARLNPLVFLNKMRAAIAFAFGTASSNATIPVTLRTVTQRLGVDRAVASFTVPLGATINMDGTAIMQGVATLFIAQAYGVDLTLAQLGMVVITATLASIGTAGVPGVGLIMLSMVLQQVGLPVEGIGLIIGIDRLLDMTRTAVNVTGDAAVTCIVAKSEGRLDEKVFYDPEAGEIKD